MRWNEFRFAEPILAQDDNFRLRVARPQDVADKRISLQAKQFFLEAGLPWSAEPSLWFDGVSKGLPRVWEVYGPQGWEESEKQKLAHYFVIGSTEENDPICLNENKGGKIFVLAHDHWFQTWQFVNSSVMQFAEFLLLFNSAKSHENLQSVFERIDAMAIEKNNFWWQALNNDY